MALLSLLSCATSPIITSTTCDTDPGDRFYFDLFRFPSQVEGDKVYFKATVIVCLESNNQSVCQSECAACSSKRTRRETVEEIQQTEFYVTAGPFQIRDLDRGLCLKNSCFSINQSIDRSIDRSVSQSVSQSVNQSIRPSVSQSVLLSVNQSVSPAVNLSINQSINQSKHKKHRWKTADLVQILDHLISQIPFPRHFTS